MKPATDKNEKLEYETVHCHSDSYA